MARRHRSLEEFMAMENENFGGYRINGRPVSREEYAAVYNGEYDEASLDEDFIAKILGQGLLRRGGNY